MAIPLSLKETADLLGISTVTVINWEKQGYLNSFRSEKGNSYSYTEVFEIKRQIEKGSFAKLASRANKKGSKSTFLPFEYFENPGEIYLFNEALELIHHAAMGIEESIFFLCLNMLQREKLVNSMALSDIFIPGYEFSSNRHINQDLNLWVNSIVFTGKTAVYEKLLQIKLPAGRDIPGTFYQTLLTEGHKSREGSYYTPHYLADQVVSDLIKAKVNYKVLDPCCGTGQFLLAAAVKMKNKYSISLPENLWGYDIDPLAVKIARINLYLQFPEVEFSPNIYQKNIIFNYTLGRKSGIEKNFDLVLSNPPWGADLKFEQTNFLKDNYPIIYSFESFSYFLYIANDLLTEGGRLSFILPESVTNVKTHADIRAYLLRNAHIEKIETLGRVFKGVFTTVIRLDLQKSPDPHKETEIVLPEKTHYVSSARFSHNKNKILDIYLTKEDERLINKVYLLPHTRLEKKADWILGIVTGNNSHFLSKIWKPGYEEIYVGTDVEKFYLKKPTHFILPDLKKMQQVAPIDKFRAKEKIIYRFINKHLIFALDNQQKLALNSANSFVPEVPGYPYQLILALFNSSLYQFIFQKKYFTHKVLRQHLEELPLILPDKQAQQQIITMVDVLTNPRFPVNRRKDMLSELDNLIFKLAGFDDEERELVKSAIE
jgi:type I restriction-modification system DNA methylase subunit